MRKSILQRGIRARTAGRVIGWVVIVSLQAAQAGDLNGQDDPAFGAALETWLMDNDRDSLPVFAELAAGGNTAARLLLSRIEVTDLGPSEFVSRLSRKERVELFRSSAGKGLFKPTWLKTEAKDGNQFAATLLQATNTVVDIDAIRDLYKRGEPEAAYDLIREAMVSGSAAQKQELAEILPRDSELMPFLRALQDPVGAVSIGHTALQLTVDGGKLSGPEADTGNAAYFVEHGYQTGVRNSQFDQANFYYDGLANWIMTAPVTAPIASACRQACGEATRSCAITSFGLVGGYYKAIRFDSPLQSLVSQSRFVASERASGTVLRRIAFARPAGAASELLISDEELAEKSACLAGAVAEIRERRIQAN